MKDFDHDEKLLNRESDSSNSISDKNDDTTVPAVGEILQKEFMEPITGDESARLQHSYEQSVAGEGRPMDEVFDDLERGLKQLLHIRISNS